KLGGQAQVKGVSGTWKDLTDNVNQLAENLTTQVRAIAEVTTAVAKGDLSHKITVEARGEIVELKNNINRMIGQLCSITAAATRGRWARRGSWAARLRSKASPERGRASPTTSTSWRRRSRPSCAQSRRSRPRSPRAISRARSTSRRRARSRTSRTTSTR